MEKLLLLVDDEPSILKSLKRLFRPTDYTVLTASSAYQALDIIRERPVSVLVSDYTMPGLNGADLLAMAKSLRPDIYAVILSGNNDQQSVIRSINEGGAAKFITKPWSDQDLIATVDQAYKIWLDKRYSLQISGLLNQKTYRQHLDTVLGNPYLNDYILLCFELQDLREVRHQLSDNELHSLFTRIFPESGAIGHVDSAVAMLDDGRLSACIKVTGTQVKPEEQVNTFLALFPELIEFQGHQLPIRFNTGYTISSRFCHNGDMLLKNASIALNLSRHSNHSRTRRPATRAGSWLVQFETGMESQLATELSITSSLHHALERGEFSIVYQPKIQYPEFQIRGAEALIRWNNPTFGMVSPDAFIPVAEEYGLINDIGDWVLNTASRQWTSADAEWRQLQDAGATLSINVSSIQLADPQYISRFAAAINASGISPTMLELEVTESSLIKDINNAIIVLAHIRELGVKISIDDFGTGYSSLSYLNKLPADIIKIDRSFVSAMFHSSSALNLVRNLLVLGKDMGLDVIAEGVEEHKQVEKLSEFGCKVFQGYFFSRPLPADQFKSFATQSQIQMLHKRAS